MQQCGKDRQKWRQYSEKLSMNGSLVFSQRQNPWSSLIQSNACQFYHQRFLRHSNNTELNKSIKHYSVARLVCQSGKRKKKSSHRQCESILNNNTNIKTVIMSDL